MNENAIRTHLAALNGAWQRSARTADEQLDPETAEGLNRDYLAAWEGLDACGIAEWMLDYDAATLTFSLPLTGETAMMTSRRCLSQRSRTGLLEIGNALRSLRESGRSCFSEHPFLLLLVSPEPIMWEDERLRCHQERASGL